MRVIGIGDNVCDIYKHLGKMFPGGQALNFSVNCRRAGYKSSFLGAFGSCLKAKHNLYVLTQLGIDASRSRHYEGENGFAVIELVDGDRNFLTSNKGGVLKVHNLCFNDEDLEYIQSHDIVHTSNNSYIFKELEKLSKLDCVLSYDFSKSFVDDDRTKEICKHIDFAFMSCDEKIDDIKKRLQIAHNWGAKVILATRGEKGAILYCGSKYYQYSPIKVNAIDTLGAGDAFAARFLTAYVEQFGNNFKKVDNKEKIDICFNKAGEMARKACMVHGAFGMGTDIK